MKTKLRYNHAAYFGNFSVDALEAYLPREIEVEQNEDMPHLEVDLKMVDFSIESRYVDWDDSKDSWVYDSKIAFSIEGVLIIVDNTSCYLKNKEEISKDALETKCVYIKEEITRIINEQFSNMVDAIKGNQEDEIEKQKTEEFIRHNF